MCSNSQCPFVPRVQFAEQRDEVREEVVVCERHESSCIMWMRI
ncbi:hypothetical protein BAMA111019_06510 [Bacillus manliponensis]